ncbi:hypothetical protein [Halovivax cerinus]|nr:hypothetical protein [Halovivax cerinus]
MLGSLGGLLYITADFTLGWSVFQSTTTIGMVFFTLAVYGTHRFLVTDSKRMLGVALICYLMVLLTHQSTGWITLMALVAILAADYHRERRFHIIGYLMILGVSLVQFWRITRYSGPEGDAPDVVSSLVMQLIPLLSQIGFRSSGGGGGETLPEGLNVATSVAGGLTPIHVVGSAVLFGLAAVGVIRHLGHRWDQFGVQFTALIGILYLFAFGGPLFNIDFFFPMRWFQFISFALAPFAAIGLREVFTEDIIGRVALPALILFCGVWFAIMAVGFIGAVDGPIADDAHSAQRYAANDNEYAMYEFVDAYGDDSSIIADGRASTIIRRYYDNPNSSMLTINHSRNKVQLQSGSQLVIERPYLYSGNALYQLKTTNARFTVFGKVPQVSFGCDVNMVYKNGESYNIYQKHNRCVG